jgi:predicted DNA-binding antitoxin AbrB/MazE fold protein
MVIHAVYENGVFRPIEHVELPNSCKVQLTVQADTQVSSRSPAVTPLSKLAAIATEHEDNADLPTDLAEQHDHYLYGAPKRR